MHWDFQCKSNAKKKGTKTSGAATFPRQFHVVFVWAADWALRCTISSSLVCVQQGQLRAAWLFCLSSGCSVYRGPFLRRDCFLFYFVWVDSNRHRQCRILGRQVYKWRNNSEVPGKCDTFNSKTRSTFTGNGGRLGSIRRHLAERPFVVSVFCII